MKIIKTVSVALACAVFVAPASADAQYALDLGAVYVHTARNAPQITADGKTVDSFGDALPASNVKFKCGDGQKAFFVLSNNTVVFMGENSEAEVVSLRQSQTAAKFPKNETEAARSECLIDIKKGDFFFVCPRLRPSSVMKISSPFGTFDVQSTEFAIKVSENGMRISLVAGQASFKDPNGKTDFLKNKQTGTIAKSDTKERYPLRISYVSVIDEEKMKPDFERCRNVFRSVVFKSDDNGKISAERVVHKEFLMRRADGDYR